MNKLASPAHVAARFRRVRVSAAMIVVAGLGVPGAAFAEPLKQYNVDIKQTSVSGLSSGAFFAIQFHLAHSNDVQGVGVIAGGPYFCAEGDIYKAFNAKPGEPLDMMYDGQCMGGFNGRGVDGGSVPAINVDPVERSRLAAQAASSGKIDPLSNLVDDKVFVLGGTVDPTVVLNVSKKNKPFYESLGVLSANIMENFDLAVGHALPVLNDSNQSFINPCGAASRSPWISDCGYDTAGEMLKHFYNLPADSRVPTSQIDDYGAIVAFDQTEFKNAAGAKVMGSTGYAYVPNSCKSGEQCRVHIALHGCKQAAAEMGEKFYRYGGYNNWAARNHIIVLYPQTDADPLLNPNGCWDWWGFEESSNANGVCPSSNAERGTYSGCSAAKYHTRDGVQIKAVHAMLSRLAGTSNENGTNNNCIATTDTNANLAQVGKARWVGSWFGFWFGHGYYYASGTGEYLGSSATTVTTLYQIPGTDNYTKTKPGECSNPV